MRVDDSRMRSYSRSLPYYLTVGGEKIEDVPKLELASDRVHLFFSLAIIPHTHPLRF